MIDRETVERANRLEAAHKRLLDLKIAQKKLVDDERVRLGLPPGSSFEIQGELLVKLDRYNNSMIPASMHEAEKCGEARRLIWLEVEKGLREAPEQVALEIRLVGERVKQAERNVRDLKASLAQKSDALNKDDRLKYLQRIDEAELAVGQIESERGSLERKRQAAEDAVSAAIGRIVEEVLGAVAAQR